MDTSKAFGGEHIFPLGENKKQTFLSVSGGEIVTPDTFLSDIFLK